MFKKVIKMYSLCVKIVCVSAAAQMIKFVEWKCGVEFLHGLKTGCGIENQMFPEI